MNRILLIILTATLIFSAYANTVEEANALIENGKYEKGATILFNLATKNNNPKAYYRLGVLWSQGIGLKRSDKRAFQAYLKGAELGDKDAQNGVGSFYFKGRYVEKNYKEAFNWFLKSADQGNNIAMNTIAGMYLKGYGVEKNQDKAIRWFKIAYKQGNQQALENIVNIYRHLANKNDPGAMHNLALILTRSNDKNRNSSEGVAWFEKAARKGVEQSRLELVKIYRDGLSDFSANAKKQEYWNNFK